MNIPGLINKITEFILKFNLHQFVSQLKPLVVLAAIVGMVLILIAAFFSLIPQF